MKSIAFTKYGSPDDLQLIDIPIPAPVENEVLVKIHASSINSWDLELLNATPFINRLAFGLFRPKRLKTLGIDVAGLVENVGSGVTQFQPGDRVYGDLSAVGWGGFAEYVAVPANALTSIPDNISFEQAAAIPHAGLLALQGLVDEGNIRDGMKILINGASGGSGTIAIQIAKQYDVEITGVCSTEKMDFVRSLGADHIIDYKTENFTRTGQHYDLILDAKAYYSLSDYRHALTPDGIYVVHGGGSGTLTQLMTLGPIVSLFTKRKLTVLFHHANKGLDRMRQLLADGKVKPVIDRTFTLEQVPEAMHYYAEGKTRGKLIIKCSD